MPMKLQVGVKALIVNSDNKYLLMKRAVVMENDHEPHWDMPGGRINPEESLSDALRREILEETGLTISGKLHLMDAQDIFAPTKDLHVVRLTYAVDGDGNAITSAEHSESAWFFLSEALALNLDPYLRTLLEAQKDT